MSFHACVCACCIMALWFFFIFLDFILWWLWLIIATLTPAFPLIVFCKVCRIALGQSIADWLTVHLINCKVLLNFREIFNGIFSSFIQSGLVSALRKIDRKMKIFIKIEMWYISLWMAHGLKRTCGAECCCQEQRYVWNRLRLARRDARRRRFQWAPPVQRQRSFMRRFCPMGEQRLGFTHTRPRNEHQISAKCGAWCSIKRRSTRPDRQWYF